MNNRVYHSKWLDLAQGKNLVIDNDLSVYYQVIGNGPETLVLLNGLGGRLYSWEPILDVFADQYKIITWDYRGIFNSGAPQRMRELSIPYHVEDLKSILAAEKVKKATLIGWSMGVQVALEMASLYPDTVNKLILINGTYGQALSAAFQPLFRISGLNRFFNFFIDTLRGRDAYMDAVVKLMRAPILLNLIGQLMSVARENPKIPDAIGQYAADVFGPSFPNYLRLFQELDSHSTYHLLSEIKQPTLIISGGLDMMTPAYQSYEMAAKIPGSHHEHFPLGSHFALLEYPEKIPQLIKDFLLT